MGGGTLTKELQLGVVVNGLLDKMVTIFGEAKINRDAPRFLEQDVARLIGLCENFLESAKTDRGARDSEDALFRMKEQDLNLRSVLAEYEDYKPWTLAQAEAIKSALQGILGELETLMNISEREVAEAIISHIKVCLVSVKAVVQAGPHQGFDALADDMTYNCLYLARVLDNRVTVTRDPELREKLHRANVTLKAELTPVVQSCNAVRSDASSYNLDQKETHVKNLSGALRDALDVVNAGLAAMSEFSYRGIEPDKFNDKLDDLIGAINSGDARNVADNARFLAGQLSDLDRRKGLEDAKRRLREQTADLLQASKDALKDKDSEDAKNRLNNIVAAMKNQVADLAAQEEAKRRRQQEILKSAGGIGLAMMQMEQAATREAGGSSGKTASELTQEAGSRFGSEIRADEAKREAELRDRSRNAGVTYTAPGDPYPRADFSYSAPAPSQTKAAPAVSKKVDEDAELEAMLNGMELKTPRNNAPSSSSAKPAARAPKMSKEDDAELAALLGGLDSVAPLKSASKPTPAPTPVAAKPAPAAAKPPSSNKDDAELDALLGDLGEISFKL